MVRSRNAKPLGGIGFDLDRTSLVLGLKRTFAGAAIGLIVGLVCGQWAYSAAQDQVWGIWRRVSPGEVRSAYVVGLTLAFAGIGAILPATRNRLVAFFVGGGFMTAVTLTWFGLLDARPLWFVILIAFFVGGIGGVREFPDLRRRAGVDPPQDDSTQHQL